MADLVLRINRALMIRPVEYEYIGVRAVVMVTRGCNAHTPQGCCPDLAPISEDLISYATWLSKYICGSASYRSFTSGFHRLRMMLVVGLIIVGRIACPFFTQVESPLERSFRKNQ